MCIRDGLSYVLAVSIPRFNEFEKHRRR